MAFKESSKMDQQIQFIQEVLTEEFTFTSLCNAYSISRNTGYKLLKRYHLEGFDAFKERSRKPLSNPNTTCDLIIDKIIFWRRRKEKNRWGAKKIRVKLLEELGEDATPSVTTIHNILIRSGDIKPRKKRRVVTPANPKFDPESSNEIWSIDHKGHFELGNRKRCHPLTVCDSYSRYLFLAKGQYNETFAGTRSELRRLFREFGQPTYLHSDNGTAFASIQSPCGYGSLSYWLIDHGIQPLFSDPGRPTQNGRHERMHRDLKAECCCPSSKDLRVQNRKMNGFRYEYNEVRPHEAIGQQLPGRFHEASRVAYREKVESAEYDTNLIVRKVCQNGALRWRSHEWVSISSALAGKYVGLQVLAENTYAVYYRSNCLGMFTDGVDIVRGEYYRLKSDRDLPPRQRDEASRRRSKS